MLELDSWEIFKVFWGNFFSPMVLKLFLAMFIIIIIAKKIEKWAIKKIETKKKLKK
jgi:hypothetical protein